MSLQQLLYIDIVVDLHDNDCMKNTANTNFSWGNSQAVNTRATFPPTCHIGRHQVKKLSMEAAGCFFLSRPSQTFPCVNDAKHLSIALAESAEKYVAEKLPEKVARLCRTFLNSNRGIRCTQKLHVDFHTQKIVFENAVNISQNERLSQSQRPRNIASNKSNYMYVCTTQIAPPLRDDIIRRAKTSFAIKNGK